MPSSFLLVVAFAWLSRPSWASLVAGIPISLLGIVLRGWAAGHLAKNRNLARGGPYAHLRNPLYVGTLTVAAGLAIASRQPWLAVLFGAVFLFVYLPVIELEEQHLRKLFPEYARYAEDVPALLPRWSEGGDDSRFSWPLYRRNQEYQALLGFLAGLALLAWKAAAS